MPTADLRTRQSAWYAKSVPTFVDALALVRRQLWTQTNFPTSLSRGRYLLKFPDFSLTT